MSRVLVVHGVLALLSLIGTGPVHDLLHHGPQAVGGVPTAGHDELHDGGCPHFPESEQRDASCLACGAARAKLAAAALPAAVEHAQVVQPDVPPEGSPLPRSSFRIVLGARGPPGAA